MPAAADAIVQIPAFDRLVGAFGARWPRFMQRLGDLESRTVADELGPAAIDRPVYVCGLARAGSTVLLEALAASTEFTSHHYSDYPLLWTPYWWNRLRARLPLPAVSPQPRAHRDRVAVTPDSPEAFEEILWMHFFPGRHDPSVDQVLGADVENAAFDTFYALHIRKLLAARGRPRYLAKGNYNLARLAYIARRMPSARFIIAVREPLAHVASLVKQDRLFVELARANPAVARHLARCGHFEFGPHKTSENLADTSGARSIQACFEAGNTAEGYARQWNMTYAWLLRGVAATPELARACLLVPYDDLCARPLAWLARIYAHAGIGADEARRLIVQFASRFSLPDYYSRGWEAGIEQKVQEITAGTWQIVISSTTMDV